MLSAFITITALVLAGYLAFSARLRHSVSWQSTVTPLASIMGSGFLVCAPLLANTVGNLAVFCMAGLLVLAYAVGGAIRFNIRHFEPIENDRHGPAQAIGFISRLVLAGAYFISVSYYLQLLGVLFPTLLVLLPCSTHFNALLPSAWRGMTAVLKSARPIFFVSVFWRAFAYSFSPSVFLLSKSTPRSFRSAHLREKFPFLWSNGHPWLGISHGY